MTPKHKAAIEKAIEFLGILVARGDDLLAEGFEEEYYDDMESAYSNGIDARTVEIADEARPLLRQLQRTRPRRKP